MAVDIVIQETIDVVNIIVQPNVIEVNVTRTSGGGGTQTLAQTLALGNTTGGENIVINDADSVQLENSSKLSQGIVDAGTGGNKGIALTCAVGYEWKWEAGEAYLTNLSGNQIDAKQYARSVPTPTDDDTKGFYSGSYWYTLTGIIYKCNNSTTGAASWQLVINTPDLQEVTDVSNVTSNDLIVRNPDAALKQVIIKRASDGDDTSSVFAQYDADTYAIVYSAEGQSGIGGSVYDPAGISEFTLNPGGLSTYNSLCSMSLQGGDLNLTSAVAKPIISMVGVGGAVEIRTNLLTGNRLQEVPDKNGTFAMLDDIPAAILRNNYFWFLPYIITNNAASTFAYSERIFSGSFILLLNGNLLRGMVTFSTTAIAGTIASMRQNNGLQLQGYECKFTRKIQFNSNVSGQRFFCGISKGNQFAIATNVEPNTLTDIVGVCQLSTSTNMHIVYNDASGVATTSDLGSSYPCNDSQYNYYITVEQTTTSYIITVERVTVATGASISTSLTTSTNIPVYNTGIIQLFTFITNNATASIASYLDGGAIGSFKN